MLGAHQLNGTFSLLFSREGANDILCIYVYMKQIHSCNSLLSYPPPPAALVPTDSWQTESAPSFSPAFGGGTGNSLLGVEASLSVLADGSAGFEPPAPPTVESDLGHRHQPNSNNDAGNESLGYQDHNRPGNSKDLGNSNQQGSGIDGGRGERGDGGWKGAGAGEAFRDDRLGRRRAGRGERGDGGGGGDDGGRGGGAGGGGNGVGDRHVSEGNAYHHQGTEANSSTGDHHHSTHGQGIVTAADENSTAGGVVNEVVLTTPMMGSDSKEEVRVLHGISAAMALGALPAARPNPHPNPTAAANRGRSSVSAGRPELLSDGHEGMSNYLPHLVASDDARVGGPQLDTGGVHETTFTRVDGGHGRMDGGEGSEHGVEASIDDNFDPGGSSGSQGSNRNWHKDDMGEQARRQIDQALRERALRRRNRYVNVHCWGGYAAQTVNQEIPRSR